MSHRQLEKGHGRLEERVYEVYSTQNIPIGQRWDASGIQTVVSVERQRWQAKTNRTTADQAWFVSNLPSSSGLELIGAIRNHWHIEAD